MINILHAKNLTSISKVWHIQINKDIGLLIVCNEVTNAKKRTVSAEIQHEPFSNQLFPLLLILTVLYLPLNWSFILFYFIYLIHLQIDQFPQVFASANDTYFRLLFIFNRKT